MQTEFSDDFFADVLRVKSLLLEENIVFVKR